MATQNGFVWKMTISINKDKTLMQYTYIVKPTIPITDLMNSFNLNSLGTSFIKCFLTLHAVNIANVNKNVVLAKHKSTTWTPVLVATLLIVY
jgi:hypothetical protein